MKIYDASGFNSALTGSFTGSFKGKSAGHLIPDTNEAYDLGSTNARWRDLYLSGSSIYLGDVKLSVTPDGRFNVRNTISDTETTITSASNALTASYISANRIDGVIQSASHAITASFALNAGGGAGFPYSGSAVITGSLYVDQGNISGSFVGDGRGLRYLDVPQVSTVSDNFYNATTYNVTHNFGTKNVLVSVFNEQDEIMFPDKIKATNDNNVQVTFHKPRSGRIVVAKGGHIVSGSTYIYENVTVEDSFTNALTKTVSHNFNTRNVFVSVYNTAGYLLFPEDTRIINENVVQLTFNAPTSGTVVVGKGGHIVSGSLITEETTVTSNFTSVTSTTVTHNFNTKNVIVSVYLDDDTLYMPSSITTTDVNTVRVVFDQARSGRIVIAKGGHMISGSINVVESTLFEDTFTNQTTITPVHSFGTKNVAVTVYDASDELITPSSVNTISTDQVRITFPTASSGRVIVTKGGHLVSGSYKVDYNNILNKPNLVSGSLDYSGILNKPDLVSGSGDMADLGIYGLVGLEDMFYAQMAPNKATT